MACPAARTEDRPSIAVSLANSACRTEDACSICDPAAVYRSEASASACFDASLVPVRLSTCPPRRSITRRASALASASEAAARFPEAREELMMASTIATTTTTTRTTTTAFMASAYRRTAAARRLRISAGLARRSACGPPNCLQPGDRKWNRPPTHLFETHSRAVFVMSARCERACAAGSAVVARRGQQSGQERGCLLEGAVFA